MVAKESEHEVGIRVWGAWRDVWSFKIGVPEENQMEKDMKHEMEPGYSYGGSQG